jgi:effector-binding domain-containing protein
VRSQRRGLIDERSVPPTTDIREAVEIKDVPEQLALLIRERADLDQLSGLIPAALAEVHSHMAAAGIAAAGPPLVLYGAMEDGMVDVEMGWPVEGRAPGAARVEGALLPACTMLVYEHRGHYRELGRAHQALWELVGREGLTVDSPPREVYVTDPQELPNPADWVTEIQFPLVRDEARIAALSR